MKYYTYKYVSAFVSCTFFIHNESFCTSQFRTKSAVTKSSVYRKSSIKPPGGLIYFSVLDGDLLERGDLLTIRGKKCYKNALMHFFCYGKTCAYSFKSLLTLVNYNVLIIHQLSLNSYS